MGLFDSIGNIANGIYGMSQDNPADSGMKYLDQIEGKGRNLLNPYIQAGLQMMPELQKQFGNLMNNPGGFLNTLGQGFQSSPGFDFQKNQAIDSANRVAAAGGMLGTPAEQQQIANTVNGLANQDYYNWLDRSTGLYNRGLSGAEGINQMGFNASSKLAQMIADALTSQSSLAYAGQQIKNQNDSSGFGDLISGAAGIASFF